MFCAAYEILKGFSLLFYTFLCRLAKDLQDSLALSKSISLQVSLCSDTNASAIDEDLIKPTSKKTGSQRIISSEENSPVILAANTLSDVLDEDRNSQGNILFLNDTGKPDYYLLTLFVLRAHKTTDPYKTFLDWLCYQFPLSYSK